jgi:uncharacterized Zn finger protein (UPF0148 family)
MRYESDLCPDCGMPLFAEGGCYLCRYCGWCLCEL